MDWAQGSRPVSLSATHPAGRSEPSTVRLKRTIAWSSEEATYTERPSGLAATPPAPLRPSIDRAQPPSRWSLSSMQPVGASEPSALRSRRRSEDLTARGELPSDPLDQTEERRRPSDRPG